MEIKITHMVNDNMFLLSGSVCEHGENAANITWNNSQEYAKEYPLVKESDRAYLVRFFTSMGFSEADEMNMWDFRDIQALVTQYIAGSIREMEAYETFEDYSEAHGEIFKSDNDYYIYIGE